ncbi:MAG: hypothetical protein KGK15_01305 [Burkholderiales bacterium]|nr:hypothetical protein [Burkholderiales bacterium]MDE2610191.1 hypothetical protein [Burkholderiales bacterium]
MMDWDKLRAGGLGEFHDAHDRARRRRRKSWLKRLLIVLVLCGVAAGVVLAVDRLTQHHAPQPAKIN